jgi:hypothetical protein
MEMIQNVSETAAPGSRDRRMNARYIGPFDGYRVDFLETPLSICDLGQGGCFINSIHDQSPGVRFQMKVELPRVGWVVLNAETLYLRSGYGFAVRFVEMDEATAGRLELGLEQLIDREI